MKIAIVGSGVSGLVSALLLAEDHDVDLYEANDYVGGHTHTIDVDLDGRYAVDTGFIVFNFENYPNFTRLLSRLNVASQPSSMSFSVLNRDSGLEYGFSTLNALFAQRRNIVNPSFLRMLMEIRRFRGEFKNLINALDDTVEMGQYLSSHGYSEAFQKNFLIPFGAAIWSAPPEEFKRFPLRTFVQFFLNHGFLDLSRLLQWHVVKGGSRSYVTALLDQYKGTIRTKSAVTRVRRTPDAVDITVEGEEPLRYDHVVMACHSDQALRILADPTPEEQAILGALPYQPNDVILHTDTSCLPRHQHVWSSWNYCVSSEHSDRALLTYHMNILQSLQSEASFLVTLNPGSLLRDDAVIGRYVYDHPVFTTEAVKAKADYAIIGGLEKRTHYVGAYWGYGFHEDGVESALRVCQAFGKAL